MSQIDVSNVTFAYEGTYDNIFENVSFRIDTDWKLGFIGRNGRGKTTFLNLLLGKYAYQGSIRASVDFAYFPFEITDKSQNTIDVINGINPDYAHWELEKELSLLEMEDEILHRSFETLSHGERTKVMLSALFLKPNSFLLIDEVTNHLDANGRSKVGDYLKKKKGFILVSHDRSFLDDCIDHVLAINKTSIEIQQGNFSSWWTNKEARERFETAENERLKEDIKRLSDAAKRTSHWSDKLERTKYGTKNSGAKVDRGYIGHQSAKLMKRAKAIEERKLAAIEKKSKLMRNIESADSLKIAPLKHHFDKLLSLKDIAIRYGEKTVCKNISFMVEQGDRVVLTGKNGSGKTSILKLILGEEIEYTGHFSKVSGLIISYVPQDTSFLAGDLSDFARENRIDESLFKTILRKFDFSRVQFEKDMSSYSDGQKKKVLIAKSLCEKAHLYIWDEPLNFIDVFSRMQIEELIKAFAPTMLLIEHDRSFAAHVGNNFVAL